MSGRIVHGRIVSGKVHFVGAGPGDPDLLTRKAWNLLRDAEVVLHDALVAPEILKLAPAGAIVCDVGKRCGRKSIAQEDIHVLLIWHALQGRSVVRLQGGDPLVFGRSAEEFAALREAGVEFEIVPGVTAASAAAAAAQISLTDRRSASRIIFLSAHRREGEFENDLASVPTTNTTLAIYMPGKDYAKIARQLLRAGIRPDTPCVVVSHASDFGQSVCRTDLHSLPNVPPLPSPALLIVGDVAAAAESNESSDAAALLAGTGFDDFASR